MTTNRRIERRRPLRRGLGAGIAALAGLSLIATPAAGAAPNESDEQQLLSLLNGERLARGMAALRLEATLDAAARRHARDMLDGEDLFHSAVASSAPEGWTRLAENVARADGPRAMQAALMASPAHRANILDPSFDYVGIGVARKGRLSSFAAIQFADHPSNSLETPDPGATRRWVSGGGAVSVSAGASHHGDMAGARLNAPVVGLESTPTDQGYWLVAADGGVFSFGDARFVGSAAGWPLAAPIVDMVPTPSGRGYWLVGADGGVFAFGDAPFMGSTGGRSLGSPIVRIARTANGRGYALYAADGSRYGFGNAHR